MEIKLYIGFSIVSRVRRSLRLWLHSLRTLGQVVVD